jgi:hypothetical protein
MSPVRRASSVPGLRNAVQGGQPMATVPQEVPPVPAPMTEAPPRSLPPRPAKPIRFTLDLDREHHQLLKQYAVRIEADASQVMRALLDQLRDDPELGRRVQEAIWQARDR